VIWLVPAALCSVAIALILKVNERRGGNRIVIAGANYAVAAVLSLILIGSWPSAPAPATLALGIAAGVVWVIGFLVLMAGIARGPLAVPVTVTRLAVVIPVIVSFAVWNEKPLAVQWVGIVVGLVAIFLFGLGLSVRSSHAAAGPRYGWLILALFSVMGVGDVLLKAFRETASDCDRLTFTWILFTIAAALTWAIIFVKRIRPAPGTVALGLVLGVPNLGSTVFTLLALRSVDASITFPFINIVVIAGSTAAGFAIWRERLDRLSVVGLVLAAAAIVLLVSP
jgi:drug/metabolite transporter (DMT)-like permease